MGVGSWRCSRSGGRGWLCETYYLSEYSSLRTSTQSEAFSAEQTLSRYQNQPWPLCPNPRRALLHSAAAAVVPIELAVASIQPSTRLSTVDCDCGGCAARESR